MNKRSLIAIVALTATITLSLATVAAAAKIETYTIGIKNHRFEPTELHIPAHTKVKLLIKNLDSTPEEFESYELNREKIILGGRSAIVFVGPLEPGSYPFFGEFNQNTAQGVLHVE